MKIIENSWICRLNEFARAKSWSFSNSRQVSNNTMCPIDDRMKEKSMNWPATLDNGVSRHEAKVIKSVRKPIV